MTKPLNAMSGTMSAYTPTMRERVVNWFAQNWYGDTREGYDQANKLMNVLQFTPVGAGADIYDVGRAVGSGDYSTAALTAVMAGLPGPSPKMKMGAPSAPPTTKGFRVFHGSPHSFPPVRLIEMPDGRQLYQNMNELPETPQGAKILQEYPLGRFDMSKIGTGEGAQAYGHGLYFAENEGVAKGYRDTLAPAPNAAQEAAQRALDQFGGDTEAAASHIAKFIEDNGSGMFPETVDHYRSVEKMLRGNSASPGSMYEVNINADPESFLDWDKPLSEQPESVKNLFPQDVYGHKYNDMTGGEVYESLIDSSARARTGKISVSSLAPSDRTGAVGMLREAGVPGIRYLDAGSRVPSIMAKKELADWQAQLPIAEKELADAVARNNKFLIGRKQAEVQRVKDGLARVSKEAEGTRNYVVFDDKLISIVRKYGIAGASAMLGYNLLENVSEAQANELRQIEKGTK